jgi:DNA-binding HxlR family transcriptional regulator
MQAKTDGESRRPGSDAGHDTRPCPIGRAGTLLGDRWILLILRDATLGVRRFDEFRGHLGIADNILSDRLRRLVDNQVLVKVPYHDGRRQRYEYRLTQAGADLAPTLRALADWGHRYTRGATPNAPVESVHVGCGGEILPDRSCAGCGAAVTRDEEAWVRTWRSDEPIPLAKPWISDPGEPGTNSQPTDMREQDAADAGRRTDRRS